jgi:archaellum component FlaC
MGFIKKLFGTRQINLIDILHKRLSVQENLSEKFINHLRRCDEAIGFLGKEIKNLDEKIEILENETKTQDDIIFDMRKKIEKLEKPTYKGKNK